MSGPASCLTQCPVAGCQRPPLPMFCIDHWPKASSVTRNALVKQWKRLTGKGTAQPPKKFFELLTSAVREIGRSYG